MPAECKIVALVGFVLVVVATPARAYPAFAAYAALLAAVAAVARVPPRTILRGLLIEVPFLVFALTLPFVARGPRIELLGLEVSATGAVAAGTIAAKATLGLLASILLATTTSPRAMLLGVERLRVPPLLVQIATFMVRYADVVADELRRMRVARESRGFAATDLRHAPVLARTLGALFLRAYERGERVHHAMLSRGYTGAMPAPARPPARRGQWLAAGGLPAAALLAVLAVELVR